MSKLGDGQRNKKIDLSEITLYLGAIAILVIFTVLCAVNGKNFVSVNNIKNIIIQSSIIAVIAIGQSMVILTGGIDLAIGSIVGFVGIFSGLMIVAGTPVWIACLAGIVSGAICGLANGILVSYGKVPAFIATLGTMGIIRGLTLAINAGKPVAGFPSGLDKIASATILGMPSFIVYVAVLYICMYIIMNKTSFGRYVYAVGGNRNAARLSGVKTNQVEMFVYVASGIFGAIGGILLLSRLCYADPNAGSGYELDAVAAAVIGGIALSGGQGKIVNTLVGALILGMLKAGLQILNVPTYYQTIIIGVAIIVAVFLDKAKERKAQ